MLTVTFVCAFPLDAEAMDCDDSASVKQVKPEGDDAQDEITPSVDEITKLYDLLVSAFVCACVSGSYGGI